MKGVGKERGHEILERIYEVVDDYGLSDTEYHKAIDVGGSVLSKMKSGLAGPGIKVVANTCERFGVSADWLIFGIGEKYRRGYGKKS